ncbi:MAG: long-chain fatty acid--CoA ligase [Candidatus Omnitrophota bacterium]
MNNLNELLDKSVEKFSKRIALIYGQKKISYESLKECIDKVATGLQSLDVKKGERVAILLNNCPEFVISYFAIQRCGATVVPINHMFKSEEVKYILEDSLACSLITSTGYLDMALQLNLRIDSLKHIVTITKTKDHVSSLNDWIKAEIKSPQTVQVQPQDAAVILYTSGTTGHPKGAVLTHGNLISNALACVKAIKANRKDSFICFLPLFHSFAVTVCMLMPIASGARIVLMRSARPFKRFLRSIRKNKVSIFTGIPSVYNILSEIKLPFFLKWPIIRILNPVRLCISGAAALPVETLKKFESKFRTPLLEGYGLTEASPVVSLNPIKGKRKAGSVGLPLSGVEVKVVNEDGKDAPIGEPGELLVRGPNVMREYFQLPDATRETLKEGWLFTGDIAKMDSEGYAFIVDRKKDMVNVRGLNVYPREIEEVLYQNPKVKEAAIVGIKDPHRGEIPKGFVVLKDGQSADGQELIHFLRQRMASYKVPHRIEFKDSLPKNTTGKILKRVLKDEEESKIKIRR